MGVSGKPGRASICKQGCALTSLAMAMRGRKLGSPGGVDVTPKTLNDYFVSSEIGYTCDGGDCNNLNLDAPYILTNGILRFVGEWGGSCCGERNAKPTERVIKSTIDESVVYIAHVRNETHFVLLTAWDAQSNKFVANDPFYNTTHYAYQDFTDVIMYSALPQAASVPKPYPLFQQFDWRWGNDVIVSKRLPKWAV